FDGPPQRDPNPQLGIGDAGAEPSSDEVPEGPVRERLAVGDAPALQPQGGALGPRFGPLDEVAKLGKETALSDPRFARDHQDAAAPGQHVLPRRPRHAEPPVPASDSGPAAPDAP